MVCLFLFFIARPEVSAEADSFCYVYQKIYYILMMHNILQKFLAVSNSMINENNTVSWESLKERVCLLLWMLRLFLDVFFRKDFATLYIFVIMLHKNCFFYFIFYFLFNMIQIFNHVHVFYCDKKYCFIIGLIQYMKEQGNDYNIIIKYN